MGKGKLWKWEENAELDNVFEPDLQEAVGGADRLAQYRPCMAVHEGMCVYRAPCGGGRGKEEPCN